MGLDLSYFDGQTPLNEEEIDGLKITHISTQNELNEFEQLNIETALEWLIRSKPKSERVLTQKFIKQVHKKMFDQAAAEQYFEKMIHISDGRIGLSLIKLKKNITRQDISFKFYPNIFSSKFITKKFIEDQQ